MEGMADDVFRQSLIFNAKLLVRLQWMAMRALKEWDRDRDNYGTSVSETLERDILPRLRRVEEDTLRAMQAYATARHTLGLAKETEAVRSGARKLREALRCVAHPIEPWIATTESDNNQNIGKAAS
jgi:hypothetical protein